MQALGYPVLRIKLVAFVFAGALAGLAGALLANHNLFVSPSLMHWTASANLIIMVIVGGIVSATLFTLLLLPLLFPVFAEEKNVEPGQPLICD